MRKVGMAVYSTEAARTCEICRGRPVFRRQFRPPRAAYATYGVYECGKEPALTAV